MGFSSWECLGCGHPMLSEWATSPVNKWMEQVVVVESDGRMLEGCYDGYCRVVTEAGDAELISHEYSGTGHTAPGCWHQACWLLAGKPAEYKPSRGAADQGFFFSTEHDTEEPTRE